MIQALSTISITRGLDVMASTLRATRVFPGFLLSVFLIAAVLSGAGSQALAASSEKEKLLEGAKKEGQLVIYTGMDAEEANVFAREFEKKYPSIKTDLFRASGEKVLTKLLTEYRAKTFRADIFQVSVIQTIQFKNEGFLQKYVSPESNFYPDSFKDPEGYWNSFYLLPYAITYNTNAVSPGEAPKSYEDLLNPKWKGKIGLEAEQYQWFFHLLKIMGKEKGMAFMGRLAEQNLDLRAGHSLILQLVVAGEIPISVVLYANQVEFFKRTKRAPIEWVRFKGPTITAINAISIPARAPHPNAAKLFVDFGLSREGQEILGKFNRVPARPDVPPDPPNLVEGLTLYPARPEELVKNYDETVALFKKTFGR